MTRDYQTPTVTSIDDSERDNCERVICLALSMSEKTLEAVAMIRALAITMTETNVEEKVKGIRPPDPYIAFL